MKAILEFDLPEEQEDFENTIVASKVFLALWEYDQWLRNQYKHGDHEWAYEAREKFREMLSDEGINIEGGIIKDVKRQWWRRLT